MKIQEDTVEWLKKITHWKKVGVDQGTLPLVDNIRDLQKFLLVLKSELETCENIEDCLQKLPQVGQLLGHICSLPILLSDEVLCASLFECIVWFFVPNPVSTIQKKSSSWAVSQIRGMTSHKKDFLLEVPLTLTGLTQADFHSLLLEEIEESLEAELKIAVCEPQGLMHTALHPQKKIMEWIRICAKIPNNKWFKKFLPKLLLILIKATSPENAETEKLLSHLTETQVGAYMGDVDLELGKDALHILWSNYPPSLEQEVLSLLEYLCQQPHLDEIDIPCVLELRGLTEACQNSPYIHGMVLAIIKQLQNEGADFALKNALEKIEHILVNKANGQ